MDANEKKSISNRISTLEVGQRLRFDIRKMLTIRTLACNLGLVNGRRYVTNVDRSTGAIYVTRTL